MPVSARKLWRPLPVADLPDGLILFDGVCVFCSRWVRFVIDRDAAMRFRFVAVQDPRGQALARQFGIDPAFPETNAVILGGTAYFKSDAALRVLSLLPRWGWVRALAWMPRTLRDFAYDRIARNRYRLFGRNESCLLPTPELAARFLRDVSPPG